MMELTGDWKCSEEFDGGFSTGIVKLIQQKDNSLSGTIYLLEHEQGAEPIFVVQKVEGIVMDDYKVVMKSKSYEIKSGDKTTEYFLDSWEGIVNSEGNIVGNSIDLNGACGVFILKKLDD